MTRVEFDDIVNSIINPRWPKRISPYEFKWLFNQISGEDIVAFREAATVMVCERESNKPRPSMSAFVKMTHETRLRRENAQGSTRCRTGEPPVTDAQYKIWIGYIRAMLNLNAGADGDMLRAEYTEAYMKKMSDVDFHFGREILVHVIADC